MELVTSRTGVIYLRENDPGEYEIVNPDFIAPGVKLFSLKTTVLDNGAPEGFFFFVPETIFAEQIIPKRAEVIAQDEILSVNTIVTTLFVDGTPIDVQFTATTSLAVIVAAINNAVTLVLGSEYSNFAEVYPNASGDRIRLRTPSSQNSSIEILEDTEFSTNLKFTPGEYLGDLPSNFRSYVENEPFVLFQERVTPNNGTPSGTFFPVLKENNIFKFQPEFDVDLINRNPRLKLLVDGFSYMVTRIDQEITRFVDQIDLSKIEEENIELLAYMFGIDLNELIQDDDLISAREVLKSIMNIIHIKGTNDAFTLILKFAGLDSNIQEFRADGDLIDVTITDTILNAFYDRYIKVDSPFRNPILNYGSSVNEFADLPNQGFDQEVIKVLNEDAIYQWSLDSGSWNLIFNSTSPITGAGTPIDDFINDLDWTFDKKDQPYIKISADRYNDLKLINGLDLLPGTSNFYAIPPSEFDPNHVPVRGQIIGENPEPYDMTQAANKTFTLFVDERTLIEFDISNFENQISDITAVTIAELKSIIEQSFSGIIVTSSIDNRIVFKSERFGSGSSIRVLDNNAALGINLQINRAAKKTKNLKITDGTANTNDDGEVIPSITVPTDVFKVIQSATNEDAEDGDYVIYAHKDGDIIIVSLQKFAGSVFEPDFGWVSRTFDVSDVSIIGTVTFENGEIIKVEQNFRQSDFAPTSILTEEQESAIRGYIRSKLTVAGRSGDSSVIDEGALGTDVSYFLRSGEVNNTDDPGIRNEIVINSSLINPDDLVTEDLINQSVKFISYVRPVHIEILSLLLNLSPLRSDWPRVTDRFIEGDYVPGFHSGSQARTCLQDSYNIWDPDDASLFPGTTFQTQMAQSPSSPLGIVSRTLNSNGFPAITNNPSDVLVWVDGVLLPDDGVAYTVTGSTGTIELAVAATKSMYIDYCVYDNRFPWELDINSDVFGAYKFDTRDNSWFTQGVTETANGNDFNATSGENPAPEFDEPQFRNNPFLTGVSVVPSTGLGTASYQDWLNNNTLSVVYGSGPVKTIDGQGASVIPSDGDTVTINGLIYEFDLAAGGIDPSSDVAVAFTGGETVEDILKLLATAILSDGHGPFGVDPNADIQALVIDSVLYITPLSIEITQSTSADWTILDVYSPLRKPMVSEFLHNIGVGLFTENAFVAVLDNITTAGGEVINTTEPYYLMNSTLHLGHTNKNLSSEDLGSETFTKNLVYLGKTNGALFNSVNPVLPPDGNLSDARLGTPYFLGSENYDGGTNGELLDIDEKGNIVNNYTDSLDPDTLNNRHYRNRGMHNTEGLVVGVFDPSGPLSNITHEQFSNTPTDWTGNSRTLFNPNLPPGYADLRYQTWTLSGVTGTNPNEFVPGDIVEASGVQARVINWDDTTSKLDVSLNENMLPWGDVSSFAINVSIKISAGGDGSGTLEFISLSLPEVILDKVRAGDFGILVA